MAKTAHSPGLSKSSTRVSRCAKTKPTVLTHVEVDIEMKHVVSHAASIAK